ncbi:hypothetical protein J6590_054006 [Homalodisca vitripennis]|nr:hypothetical protein J6590_054006 [Homalodisca vitripennis]
MNSNCNPVKVTCVNSTRVDVDRVVSGGNSASRKITSVSRVAGRTLGTHFGVKGCNNTRPLQSVRVRRSVWFGGGNPTPPRALRRPHPFL